MWDEPIHAEPLEHDGRGMSTPKKLRRLNRVEIEQGVGGRVGAEPPWDTAPGCNSEEPKDEEKRHECMKNHWH